MNIASNRKSFLSRLMTLMTRVVMPVVVIAALLAIQFINPQYRERIRDNAFDELQLLAPLPYRESLPVRVVAIDDASLVNIGQWPWPRTLMASMIDKLTEMGARVVSLDMVLSEPDRTSPEQIVALYPEQLALHPILNKLPVHDRILAESFSRSKVAIAFPIEVVAISATPPPVKSHFLSFGGNAIEWLPHYGGGLSSLPVLTDAAKGSGAISLEPDSDGVLRAIPLLYDVKNTLYPGLGLETLRLFSGLDNFEIQVVPPAFGKMPGITGVGLGHETFFPTASDGRVWLHFRALAPERYLSAKDVLAGKIDPALVKDHIVFIGATAKGLGDTIHSPLGELIPGVEGHVQLVEQLMTGGTLLRPAWENDLLVVTLTATALMIWLLLARFRPVWTVLLLILVITSLFALSFWLFVSKQLLLDPVYPALAVILLFIIMVVPRYLQTELEQRWISKAFSRYISPNRVKYLQQNPHQLELGAVYRECSFVMTDLEGFTPLMEKYPPDKLASLINEYLDGMLQIVFKHEGTLDRIVGDAVGVMFSAPLVQEDHAARALACALEMDEFSQACSLRQRELGIPFGRTRIGVNTGNVLIGNFGGQSMLDYRALGDAINTAARLESINKRFGTRICVSATVIAQCDGFIGRPVGRLVLKGKSESVNTFEPVSAMQAAQPQVIEYIAAYELMEAELPEAKIAFQKLAEKYPQDSLAVYHAQRLLAGEVGSTIVMRDK